MSTTPGEPDGLPCRSTSFYRSLAQCQDPRQDPIAAQYIPQAAEQLRQAEESEDPLDDMRFMVSERLIHRYPDRVLLLSTDGCAVYCRHCFRRHFTGGRRGAPGKDEIERVCGYLAAHHEVHEILVSGGDPLTLTNTELQSLLGEIRRARPDILVRVCSRIPVVNPERITADTVRILSGDTGQAPTTVFTWFVTQANHPREVSPAFQRAVHILNSGGVPVMNQAVLLRGINDNADTLEQLLRALYRCGVKPYYLLQADLASGTSHFRVEISRGIELMQELRRRLSGPAIPVYALDLPGGGGKVPLESALLRTEERSYVLRGPQGGEFRYPRGPEPYT